MIISSIKEYVFLKFIAYEKIAKSVLSGEGQAIPIPLALAEVAFYFYKLFSRKKKIINPKNRM